MRRSSLRCSRAVPRTKLWWTSTDVLALEIAFSRTQEQHANGPMTSQNSAAGRQITKKKSPATLHLDRRRRKKTREPTRGEVDMQKKRLFYCWGLVQVHRNPTRGTPWVPGGRPFSGFVRATALGFHDDQPGRTRCCCWRGDDGGGIVVPETRIVWRVPFGYWVKEAQYTIEFEADHLGEELPRNEWTIRFGDLEAKKLHHGPPHRSIWWARRGGTLRELAAVLGTG